MKISVKFRAYSCLFAFFMSIILTNNAYSKDIEIARITINPVKFPVEMNIVGVATGMQIEVARNILISDNYNEIERGEENIGCFKGGCLLSGGSKTYKSRLDFRKENEVISLYVMPPFYGSMIYRIERKISYGGEPGNAPLPMPLFEEVLKASSQKFGQKRQHRTITNKFNVNEIIYSESCWGVKDNRVVEPHKKILMCNDNLREKNAKLTDGYIYLYYTSPGGSRARYMSYSMLDKVLLKEIEFTIPEKIKEIEKEERALARQYYQSGKTPKL